MGRPFRFGVINEQPLAPAAWRAHVRRIEALGYATFLIRDHVVPDYFGPQYAPLAAMMAAADASERLRIGSLVLDNDYRHPVILAKEAATIDMLSGGRLELGLGAGWLRREYALAGIPFDSAGERIVRLAEALLIIKGLLRGESVVHQGQYYQIGGLESFPLPQQRPHPPILIGGGKRRVLTLAGREADIVGVLTTSVASGTLDDDPRERMAGAVAEKIGWVREGAGARFDAIELSLVPTVLIADDRRRRTEELIATRGWHGVTVEDVWAMPSVLIGSVAQIVEDLVAQRAEYGFSYYVIGDDQIEQFAPIMVRLAGV